MMVVADFLARSLAGRAERDNLPRTDSPALVHCASDFGVTAIQVLNFQFS
jgi:hypothetical protein